MTMMLANLMRDNPALKELARHARDGGQGSPRILIVLLGIVVMAATGYYAWRWQMRLRREPDSRGLLRLLGDQIGLTPGHCRLLGFLGKATGMEPAIALVCPQMLMNMVQRAQEAGVHLAGKREQEMGQILDIVTWAADSPARPGKTK